MQFYLTKLMRISVLKSQFILAKMIGKMACTGLTVLWSSSTIFLPLTCFERQKQAKNPTEMGRVNSELTQFLWNGELGTVSIVRSIDESLGRQVPVRTMGRNVTWQNPQERNLVAGYCKLSRNLISRDLQLGNHSRQKKLLGKYYLHHHLFIYES